MLIKRDMYLNKLVESINNHLIKIITGIRRCGKSYLLFNIFKNYLLETGINDDHIVTLALDDRSNLKLRDPDELLRYLKSKITDNDQYFVLLDEIQLVNEFEDVLNSLLHIENVDTYVTGSNSKFLSSDIVTEFRGRGDEIHVMPLSFSEFIQTFEGSKEEAFNEYMLHGGMPLTLMFNSDEKKEEYLKHLFEMTYLSDIIERYKLKETNRITELIRVLASSTGSLVNAIKISNTFKNVKTENISSATIENYLNLLEDSFIIDKANRYDIKGKKNIGANYKYYFTDIGLRNSQLDFLQSDYGHVMENIIYNELKFRGFSINIGVVNITENNVRKQLEVDFIASKGSKKYYIQSAYQMTNEEKIKQEKKSLMYTNDFFKKIVIVRDQVKVLRDEYGITTIGIIEFLSNVDSLDL